MASARKTHTGRWQGVAKYGGISKTKCFDRKADALTWANQCETGLKLGTVELVEMPTFGEILGRFERDVAVKHRGYESNEKFTIEILRHSILAKVKIDEIKSTLITEYISRLSQKIMPATIRKYLSIVSGVFEYALRDCHLEVDNPVKKARKPRVERNPLVLLTDEQQTLFWSTVKAYENPELYYICLIAAETGMRQANILSLTRFQIDLKRRLVFLPVTKTTQKAVPLTPYAVAELSNYLDIVKTDRLFTYAPSGLKCVYRRLMRKIGLPINFHYWRHHRASTLLLAGFSAQMAMQVTGHEDIRSFEVYSHLTAVNAVEILAKTFPLQVMGKKAE